MDMFNRREFLFSTLAASAANYARATPIQKPDQTRTYLVRDPLAGYFDLDERRKILHEMPNLALAQARLRAMRAPDCLQARSAPVQDQIITIPSFYVDNAAWRGAVKPFRIFEDTVSNLAAANLVSTDRRYANCLIDLLTEWARRDALAKFNYSSKYKQGWFQVESTLFAIGHALAAIRPDVQHRVDDLGVIDAWLLRVARSHFSIPGARGGNLLQ